MKKSWKRKLLAKFTRGKTKDNDSRHPQPHSPPPFIGTSYHSGAEPRDDEHAIASDFGHIDVGLSNVTLGDFGSCMCDDGPSEVGPDHRESTAPITPMSLPVPKMVLREDGLLDVNLKSDDRRAAITERNAKESPLLSLAGEIRNKIFSYAATSTHIHITRDSYPRHEFPPPPRTALQHNHSSRTYAVLEYEPENHHRWDHTPPKHYYNNMYDPASWPDYYTTHPVRVVNGCIAEQPPSNRYIRASHSTFTNLARVCRQMYAEIGVLPYLGNAFSFDTPYTMFHWLSGLLPVQRGALREIWVDMEWRGALWGPHVEFEGMQVRYGELKFVVSRLAVREACERWFEKSGYRVQEMFALHLYTEERLFVDWLVRRFAGPEAGFWEVAVEFVD